LPNQFDAGLVVAREDPLNESVIRPVGHRLFPRQLPD